jgi:hypothetical protein
VDLSGVVINILSITSGVVTEIFRLQVGSQLKFLVVRGTVTKFFFLVASGVATKIF